MLFGAAMLAGSTCTDDTCKRIQILESIYIRK